MINNCIFPAPPCSFDSGTFEDAASVSIVHIPRSVAQHEAPIQTHTPPFTLGILVRSPKPSPFLLLYAHPNAVDVGMMVDEMEYVSRKAGVNVLIWEYQGYSLLRDEVDIVGSSCGVLNEPGEEHLKEDMIGVYRYCLNELHVPPRQVVIMGRSIGTGPSTWLCNKATLAKHNLPPPLCLFLQAPFMSIVDCIKHYTRSILNFGPLERLAEMTVADRFRNVDLIGEVLCPVTIQHGDKDEIVNYDHSVQILAAANAQGKRDVVLHTSKGYGHNNLSTNEAVGLIVATIRRASEGMSVPQALDIRLKQYHLAQSPLRKAFIDPLAHPNAPKSTPPDEGPNLCRTYPKVSIQMFESFWETKFTNPCHAPLATRAGIVPMMFVSVVRFVTYFTKHWQQTIQTIKAQHDRQQYEKRFGVTIPRVNPPTKVSIQALRLLEQAMAVWGGPLSVFKHRSTGMMSYFGFCFDNVQSKAQSLHYAFTKEMAELHCQFDFPIPSWFLRDLLCFVHSAPDLTKESDLCMYLNSAQLDRIQLHLERLVGFLPDDQWIAFQDALRCAHTTFDESCLSASTSLNGNPSLKEIAEGVAALKCLMGVDGASRYMSLGEREGAKEEWAKLLRMCVALASPDGLVRQVSSEGDDSVTLDPAWSQALDIRHELLQMLSHPGEAQSVQTATLRESKKKSDDDCSMM